MIDTIRNNIFVLVFHLLSSFVGNNVFAANNQCVSQNVGPSMVSVSNRQLIVSKRNSDNTLMSALPYAIKGVAWSPASKQTNTSGADPNNANVRRVEFRNWYKIDIPLLKKMNVNTVRTYIDMGSYDTAQAILDELYCNDIMVIVTVDDAINDTARIRRIVNAYKNHPAILMWNIGNEWNINRYYGVASSVLLAAQRTQLAASLIKSLDVNHPVATNYGDIDINTPGLTLNDTRNYVNNICTSVDVWGLNIFRGNNFGILFSQWKSISNKPMFLGEFGTDAFRSASTVNPPAGQVDETMQARWVLSLWNDIFKNLSARDTSKVALGGTVFEWQDEWWKVQPAGSQQTGGYTGGHPDGFANEEYFGIVNIDRQPRKIYDSLRAAYHPAYQVPLQSLFFKAESAGFGVPGTFQGLVRFLKESFAFFAAGGSDIGTSRGFNVAAIDISNGELLYAVRNFDTYITRTTGTEMNNLISFLNSLPNGTLIMIAVRDEAGLTQDLSCTKLPYPWVQNGIATLEALGSIKIRNYCFRNSWSMISIKGNLPARDEQLETADTAISQTTLNLQPTNYSIFPPPAPTLVAPLCGSLIMSTNTLVSWNISVGSTNYRLQVSADSLFATALVDRMVTDTTTSFTGLENRKTYYWRVYANNAGGTSRWSCTWKFTIRIQPYAEVISVPVSLPGGTLRVKYEFFNALNSSNIFILQMTDSSGKENTYAEIARYNDTTKAGVLTTQLANNLLCSNKYRVRVLSTNPADTSNNSNPFEIVNKPPAHIQPPGNNTACTGDSILLTADLVTNTNYQWLKDGSTIPNATQKTYSAIQGGAYQVKVSKGGCDSLSMPVTLVFLPKPPKPTISQIIDTLISSAASGNQWFTNDTAIPGATGQKYNPPASGRYRVQVTINNCASDTSDRFNLTHTGIIDPVGWNGLVFIFPNPVSTELNIVNKDFTKKLLLRLYDITGRLIIIHSIQDQNYILYTDKLAKSSYLLLLTDEKKNETIRRIIIKL